MTPDREPRSKVFCQILQQYNARKRAEETQIRQGFEGIKAAMPEGERFADGLPEVSEEETPQVDNLIRRALDNVRTSHRAHLPERKN